MDFLKVCGFPQKEFQGADPAVAAALIQCHSLFAKKKLTAIENYFAFSGAGAPTVSGFSFAIVSLTSVML